MAKKYNIKYLYTFQELIAEVREAIEKRLNNPTAYEKYVYKSNIYYRIYVKNYTNFYTVKENDIVIKRIIYSRSDF